MRGTENSPKWNWREGPSCFNLEFFILVFPPQSKCHLSNGVNVERALMQTKQLLAEG